MYGSPRTTTCSSHELTCFLSPLSLSCLTLSPSLSPNCFPGPGCVICAHAYVAAGRASIKTDLPCAFTSRQSHKLLQQVLGECFTPEVLVGSRGNGDHGGSMQGYRSVPEQINKMGDFWGSCEGDEGISLLFSDIRCSGWRCTESDLYINKVMQVRQGM
ncbi:hypothetical protein BGZ63DRAFT_168595 [Mariannaea sp. PMI_226]|nr:hypothetical protein BGZ63DRAFT_168595 [Mariannaea sp. PMI_226]